MENISTILQGLAALAWPVIVIILLFSFRESLKGLFESAKLRKFTLKIAGNELTMEEASEQQLALIADTQKQIVELQKNVEMLLQEQKTEVQIKGKMPFRELKQSVVNSILWVDDNPKNNAFLIETLIKQGIHVVTALSTADGLAKFKHRRFDRIVSDLVRIEDGIRNSSAGLELSQQIRDLDPNVPIIIYTSTPPSVGSRQMVQKAGATDITASPTALLSLLQIVSASTTDR